MDKHSQVQVGGHFRPQPGGEGAGDQVLQHLGGPDPASVQETEAAEEPRGHREGLVIRGETAVHAEGQQNCPQSALCSR